MKPRASLFFVLIGLLPAASASASNLVNYTFTGSVYTPTSSDPGVVGSSVTFGSGLTSQGISGANGSPAPSLYVFANVIDEVVSATSNDYVTFTVTAADGYTINLSAFSFSYTVNSSTATPTTESGTFTVRSSIDSYADNIASFDKAAVSGQNNGWTSTGDISLSGSSYQGLTSITFRIFLSDNIATSQYAMRIDNLLLTGAAVSSVPEPSSVALIGGVVSLVAVAFRRKRSG